MMEELLAKLVKETVGVEVLFLLKGCPMHEALDRFGTDKPDLRFGMELKDISDIAAQCSFKVFNQAVKDGGQVKGIKVPGCGHYSRKDVDELMAFAARYGAKGLAWIAFKDGEIKGPLLNSLAKKK